MAQWFKYRNGVRRLLATMSVTLCVTTGMAFGQYGNSDSLNWRAPVIHGQQTNTPQQVRQSQLPPIQLVQHLEPSPALLPPVDMIDNNLVARPQPIHGTRVAQAPGLSDAARDTIYSERGRPGMVDNPSAPGLMSPSMTPGYSGPGSSTYSSLSDSAITGMDVLNRNPNLREKMIPCGNPKTDMTPMTELDVRIGINIKWDDLQPCSINVESYRPRQWPQTCFTYNAPLPCTSGAYFEHVQVERYGHSWGPFLQPVMSAAHFYGSVLFLPYKMGLTPPSECVYTVGYYRPGSCAPYMIDPIPLSVRAGLMQAGATVGLAYAIP